MKVKFQNTVPRNPNLKRTSEGGARTQEEIAGKNPIEIPATLRIARLGKGNRNQIAPAPTAQRPATSPSQQAKPLATSELEKQSA
jgi:hypothetical protein